jgi:DNA mismatch repair protein MutL
MKIRVLAEAVASQIAAGEVIERPASVIKELVENALDAGASQITVRVEDAGKRRIEVGDNGQGIAADEIDLAVARHATSKLAHAEDLFHIVTLGFRGEALASIGSVARLTLTSRQPDSPVGARLVVEGGQTRLIEPFGGAVGTLVQVEDLFYNVPARLKFLKTDQTERQQINTLVTRYALAYPQVRFELTQDAKPVLQTSGNGDPREILAQLFGVDIARQLLEVQLREDDIDLTGYISPVALTRSNRREITFFVNGRWVQDPALISALLKGYHTLLMVGRYPLATLFLSLPPEDVDVNVHPAKAEVRFRNPDHVFTTVQRAVKRALLAYSPVPQASPPSYWQTSLPAASDRTIDPAWSMAADLRAPEPEQVEPATVASTAPASVLPSGQIPLLRLVGQVGSAFLVAEGPDGLYLIDQHAAHERVLFERLLARRSEPVASQRLLEPLMLTLPAHQSTLLETRLGVLNALGFQVEPFGPHTFRVSAVPALVGRADPLAAVRSVVEDFEEDETPLQNQVEALIAGRVCKRMAIKAGQTMSEDEQRALLRDLETCLSPRTCPHGRPTMIHLSVDLLERQFGRRGSR